VHLIKKILKFKQSSVKRFIFLFAQMYEKLHSFFYKLLAESLLPLGFSVRGLKSSPALLGACNTLLINAYSGVWIMKYAHQRVCVCGVESILRALRTTLSCFTRSACKRGCESMWSAHGALCRKGRHHDFY